MKQFIVLAGALIINAAFLSSPAAAMADHAGQFIQQCDENNSTFWNDCIQYTEGVVAGYGVGQSNGARSMLCGTFDNDPTEWVRHVKRFFFRHQDLGGMKTPEFIIRALSEKWRCQ